MEEDNYDDDLNNNNGYGYQEVIEGGEEDLGDDLNQPYQEEYEQQIHYSGQENQYIQEQSQGYSKKVITTTKTTTTKSYQGYGQQNQVEVEQEEQEVQEQQDDDLGDNLDEPYPVEDDLDHNQKIINSVVTSKTTSQKPFSYNQINKKNTPTTTTTSYKYEFNKNKNFKANPSSYVVQNENIEINENENQNECYDDNLNQQPIQNQNQIQNEGYDDDLNQQPIQNQNQTQNAEEVYEEADPNQNQNQNVVYQTEVITNEEIPPTTTSKKIIKKVMPGKIMEETNNYRLYVSGIGYVDEFGNPVKKPTTSTQQVTEAPPTKVRTQQTKFQYNPPKNTQVNQVETVKTQIIQPQPGTAPNENIYESVQEVPLTNMTKNQYECVPNQNTNVYRKRSQSTEPVVYFRNLGIHSKTNEYGKRQFYRVIEATPLDYNNFNQQNQSNFSTKETVLRSQPPVVQNVIQQVPVVCPKHSVIRTTQTENVQNVYNICPIHSHVGGEEYEVVEEIQEVPAVTHHVCEHECQHLCPVHDSRIVRSQQQVLRTRGRTPVADGFSRKYRTVNKVYSHEVRQPDYRDNYKFSEIKGTSGVKKK